MNKENLCMQVTNYDLEKYNFPQILKDLFGVEDLQLLHEHLEIAGYEEAKNLQLGKDTHTKFHEIFYDSMRSDWPAFHEAWSGFIRDVVWPLFPHEKKIIYQSYPSFRIQYPESKAIWIMHCDNDGKHRHPYGEINVMIPLTKMFGTNSVWRESLPGLGDFAPMSLESGQIALWDGNRCLHYNQRNNTGMTRLSFDIRVLPRKFYNEKHAAKTATTGKSFTVGGYYSEISKI
jgi:hypothetical protein